MAAAHVGSCTSSASCFNRLAEEEDTGGAVGLLAGVFFVNADVEGDGSKPENRDKVNVKINLNSSVLCNTPRWPVVSLLLIKTCGPTGSIQETVCLI